MNNTAIKVESLSKVYNLGTLHRQTNSFREKVTSFFIKDGRPRNDETLWALKDVSFEVKRGEILGIIGPNGAGKSTLLKILSRITKPTRGKALINGRIGSLLEVGTGFHPELTGRENIYLNGSILGMKKEEISGKFDEIVAFAEINKFLDTPVKRYSSGMYVRLAFAVAAHLDPEILLVDEVLAVGDLAFQKKCLGKMEDVAQKGRTVLFISHSMSAIRHLCDQVLLIYAGKIIKKGFVEDVVSSYEKSQSSHMNESFSIRKRTPQDIRKKTFYISSIEIQNTKGEHRNVFSYNDSIVLTVGVSGDLKWEKYGIEFRIYKESGEFISVGASASYHGIYFDRNTKKVRIEIGPLILTNGKYMVSLSLISGMVRDESECRKDDWDKACYFNIIDCHPFPTKHDVDKRSLCVLQHSFHELM